ncbi:MAG: hypothetical protein Q7W30_08885 [Coriobacteriia bacterium]|nr:hypothetical protein [Coriobacteriia bacterium]
MLAFLDRISNRTAYIAMAAGIGLSLLAAFMSPQDEKLGAWVRVVIWHGMLKWACIVGIFGMGALAVFYLLTNRGKVYEWARALQFALLPLWVLAVFIGALAAKLVWNSWNLAERRMTMSVLYTMVAAVALMASLFWENRKAGAIGQMITSLAMGVGLVWINMEPASEDVHPSSAVMSSPDVMFRVYAFVMMAGCLVWVLTTAVPVKRWLEKSAAESDS